MYRRRNTRTDLDLVAAGDFAKIGRKHFRHVSGREIKYNANSHGWEAEGMIWTTLEWAAYQVRKNAPKE